MAKLGAPAAGTTIASIPDPALQAYRRAAAVMAEATPSCRLPWTLLAGVGRVESDHGRYAGATLGTDGVSRPVIIGVPLDGAGPVAAVRDTDRGSLDGDRVWDHAVGPMQFLPSIWSVVGVDGDADGRRSPDDIDDAALAAGIFLCGTSRLDVPGNTRAALLRYNHSDAYASLVMAYANDYATDATGARPQAVLFARVASGQPVVRPVKDTGRQPGEDGEKHSGKDRGKHPAATSGADGHVGGPATAVSVAYVPAAQVPIAHEPGAGPAGPASTQSAAPSPVDPPASSPADPPAIPPAVPASEPPAPPSVPPGPGTEAPSPQVIEGLWSECDEGSCLDGQPLLFGATDRACEVADYDGDGTVEPITSELVGLGGQTVAVTVLADPAGSLVLEIRGLAWPTSTAEPSGPGCAGATPPPAAPTDAPPG